MIVNQFRIWAQTAVPSLKADGASALARAYLYSDLDAAQRAEAAQALTFMLDDPSPLVRRAIAEAFASATDAPRHIVLALSEDQSSIASIVLARSPVLTDGELIDCAAVADELAQRAIATRPDLSSPVAAAIAEVGAAEALVALALNPTVTLPEFSIRRMIERHGDVAALREALMTRPDLPPFLRIDLVAATARALAAFVTDRNWLSDQRAARISHEAKDKAAIAISETSEGHEGAVDLVAHLRRSGQLTVGFILRAILSGKIELFRAALADLSGVPLARVDGLTEHFDGTGFAALYRKASLPPELFPAFRIALRAVREIDWTLSHRVGLSRGVIERVLTGCEAINNGDLDKLIVLLHRFDSEAARDEARRAPPPTRTSGALALKGATSEEGVPLLLADFDDRPPRTRRLGKEAPRIERAPAFTVDMAAIEAELMAA